MKCSKCQKEFQRPKNIVYKHGEKNFLRSLCPFCSNIVAEEKVFLSKYGRLLTLIFLLPFIFFFILLFSWAVKGSFNFNYIELQALIILSVIILFYITKGRRGFEFWKKNKSKKELQ